MLVRDSYDYLLKLPIYTLSQEEIDRLMKEKGELEDEYNELSNKTARDLWKDDLVLFKKKYNLYLKNNI